MPTTGARPRGRARFIYVLMMAGYAVLAARLFFVQVVRAREYRTMADAQHVRAIVIPAHRGVIRDRTGAALAINADAATVSVNPSFYWDQKMFPRQRGKALPAGPDKRVWARQLAQVLKLDEAYVLNRLSRRTRFEWLKRHVPLETARQLRAMEVPGLYIDDEPHRVYPFGPLAAHVLGFVNVDGLGIAGVEKTFEDALRRQNGKEVQEVDRMGRIIPGTLRSVVEPVDGAEVTLTIDSRIQQVAERELNAACAKYSALRGSCIVMDPRNAAILAMASYPPYDPNQRGKYSDDILRNRPVTDLYEPGSTMKGPSMGSALDAGVVRPGEYINCPAAIRIGNHTIHDVTHGKGAFGAQTPAGILSHSSNVGMSQVGLRLGPERLRGYVSEFGLLDKTGIALPGEPDPYLPPADDWSRHFTATVAFGQSVNFTALQLANAYCAIANGGKLMKPQIVRTVTHPGDGEDRGRVQTFPPVLLGNPIRPETSATLRKMLTQVVTDGTGKPAKIRGYQLAGKTGSAQKAIPGKGYVAGKFVASFIGFLPASSPRAVILVTVDEPKGSHWGAVTAAPVFREVARQTMWFLNVPPDDPNDDFDGSDPSTWNRQRVARR